MTSQLLFPSIFVDNRQEIFKENKGKFLVIEGIDCSGKSTQSGLLLKYLMKNNIPSVFFTFPDYTTNSGVKIKNYLQGKSNFDKNYFEMLQHINKVEKQNIILDYLKNGYYVICNRYIESQYVYGQLEGYSLDCLMSINDSLPQSNIVFVLDLPIHIIKSRLEGRKRKYGKVDRYEENTELLEKAREKYLELAQKFDNWIVIDCYKKGMKQINEEIISKLTLVLKVI